MSSGLPIKKVYFLSPREESEQPTAEGNADAVAVCDHLGDQGAFMPLSREGVF